MLLKRMIRMRINLKKEKKRQIMEMPTITAAIMEIPK